MTAEGTSGITTQVAGCFHCGRLITRPKDSMTPWRAIPGAGQKLMPDVAVACSSAESPDGGHHHRSEYEGGGDGRG